MDYTEPSSNESRVHSDVQFEESDVNVLAVIWTGVGILLSTWLLAAIAFGFYSLLLKLDSASHAPARPLSAERNVEPPPPRLQASPADDLAEVRAESEAALHSYGWLDRQSGTVSIPIERAIELLAERGIPPQPAPVGLEYPPPEAGTRQTGFEELAESELR